MDKDTELLIINALRQATIKWDGRKRCLNRVRKKVQDGFLKSGKQKYKYFWRCEGCNEWFRDVTALEVDHIDEIGSFNGSWDVFIPRMYCADENLQALCCKCHLAKTTLNARERWVRKK